MIHQPTQQSHYYDVTIALSTRNITIYQADETSIMIRQTTFGLISELCSVDPDHKVISLNVFPGTFNQPNQKYVVRIENNFVKRNDTNEQGP